jgi:hypothetical protein
MDEETRAKLKEIIGEHYPNYLIVVLDQEGEVQSDYTSVSVGRMLIKEASLDFRDDNVEVIWDEEEEEEDYG